LPLGLTELIGADLLDEDLNRLMLTGGYPVLYDRQIPASDYFPSYIQTYIERDVRGISNVGNLSTFQRFVKLCAGRVGQLLNLSSLGNELGINYKTVRSWISILEASYIVFLLQPYHKYFNKRIVKQPKLYFFDTGLLCALLDIQSPEQLDSHYLRGNIFESFIIAEHIKSRLHAGLRPNAFFWRDSTGRKEFVVVPRQFTGRLLHDLKPAETAQGDIYLEIYLNEPGSVNRVGLYRRGTRVLPAITELDHFEKEPWTAGCLQGIVDAPFLSLTPGTRHGIIRDNHFDTLCRAMAPVEKHLQKIIEEQRKAEEERSSRLVLRRVQRALKEAFLRLPQEEYDWFDIYGGKPQQKPGSLFSSGPMSAASHEKNSREGENPEDGPELLDTDGSQKQFFEYAGPLFSALITPKSSVVSVDMRKKYRVICRDRSRQFLAHVL